jgi:ABC-type polysaccharide/polyol phosphate transport system ATPase subunit
VNGPPSTGAAISLAGIGKRYQQLEEQAMLLKSILPFWRPTRTDRWALRDIDLRIEPGETVGIIGHNGAGKTTLLRLLAGVSQPSTGRLEIRGRVAPLIGVGVGFHQEMSGRENVYVNGMLLGLTKAEVDARFDDIVAFSELEDFIDTPVKFYSSGMFMRLGFAVAIHVDPQVFLVDEVLAVGDLAFQLKCFDRMRELKDRGTTIVIVSHSMHAIRLLCPRAILLRRGHLEIDGDVEDVIARHHALLSSDDGYDDVPGGTVSVIERQLLGPDGPTDHLPPGVPATVMARVRFHAAADSPQVHFTVLAEDGTVVYEMRSVIGRQHRRYEAGEEAQVEVSFTPQLAGGSFRLQLTVSDRDGRSVLHRDDMGLVVYVPPPLGSSGVADLRAAIRLDGQLLSDYSDVQL